MSKSPIAKLQEERLRLHYEVKLGEQKLRTDWDELRRNAASVAMQGVSSLFVDKGKGTKGGSSPMKDAAGVAMKIIVPIVVGKIVSGIFTRLFRGKKKRR